MAVELTLRLELRFDRGLLSKMPQWVQLPPNLVPEKHTMGKSIYTTDYSSKRPGFQLHLQKARGFQGSRHHPPVPKVCRTVLLHALLHPKLSTKPTASQIPKYFRNAGFEWLFFRLSGLLASFKVAVTFTARLVIYLVKILICNDIIEGNISFSFSET